ncbi:MAG TPA: hypothetical protein VNK04_16675 [Gemmataceae bacterium]|jgi:hypothetical protein|nr:hypothetical protein [Gemmataceae bacterium]
MMSENANASERVQTLARPFPWFCPRCRQQEVWRETIDYQCQREYGGKPVTINVTNLAVPKCRHCGELVFDYIAEEQINRAYAAQTLAMNARNGAPETFPAGEKQEQG